MADFYLTIKISGRIHVCKLSKKEQSSVFRFITTDKTFSYSTSLISENSYNPIDIDLNGPDSNNNYIISECKQKEKNRNSEQNKNLAEGKNEITFNYNKEYNYKIVIYQLEDDEHIARGILDFGSEASQMRLSCRYIQKPETIELKEEFKKFNTSFTDTDTFFQDDTAGLLKSLVFLKTESDGFYPYYRPFENKDKTFLNLLLSSSNSKLNINEFNLIPNIKLANFLEGNSINKVNIKDINNAFNVTELEINQNRYSKLHQGIIFQFIHILDSKIKREKKINGYKEDTKYYLKFKILVPNVLNQKYIYDLLNGLYEQFDKLKSKNELTELERTVLSKIEKKQDLLEPEKQILSNLRKKDFYELEAIEFSVLSESDASFLGALTKKIGGITDGNSKYLIIDAGKGTIDYSIISKKESKNYVSLFRGGIPYAGNYITFAFLETLVSLFCTTVLEMENFIKDFLNITDFSVKFKILNNLEKIKKNYSTSTTEIDLNGDEIKKFVNSYSSTLKSNINDFEAFTQHIADNNIKLTDSFGLIEARVNKIIKILQEKIVEKTKDSLDLDKVQDKTKDKTGTENKFTKVILTGRSFFFKPLYDKVAKIFGVQDQDIVFLDVESKYICIIGGIMNDDFDINNNSDLIGIPMIQTGKKQVENKSDKSKIIQKINPFRGSSSNEIFIPQSQLETDEFYYKGIKFPVSGAYVEVNDVKYKFGGIEGSPRLFFTGDNYILTYDDNRSVKLEILGDYTDNIKGDVNISLFPFCITPNEIKLNFNEEKISDFKKKHKIEVKQKEDEDININLNGDSTKKDEQNYTKTQMNKYEENAEKIIEDSKKLIEDLNNKTEEKNETEKKKMDKIF